MWEISVILVFCICLATCQQNVDTLVNEIFVRDNNGSSLRNQAENLDTYSSGSGLDLVRTESNDQYEDVTNQDEYAYGYGYDSTSEQVQTYQTTPIHVEPSNYPSSNQPALNEPNVNVFLLNLMRNQIEFNSFIFIYHSISHVKLANAFHFICAKMDRLLQMVKVSAKSFASS